ncbi:IS110 family transposase [Embleya sp. MST-111070]|uniref:IS110 family transposase n=1 Tax=Embleya sp. MST-111070 TaxID=3398231 RepID=UPI003F740A0F
MAGIWVGVDIGGTHHRCVAIDDPENTLLTRRVANDEADLRALIADVTTLGVDPVWIVDLPDGPTDLLRTLLHDRGRQLVYLLGRFMHSAASSYPGGGKSDAHDAAILADQARARRDLRTLSPPDANAVDLALLTARRVDLGGPPGRHDVGAGGAARVLFVARAMPGRGVQVLRVSPRWKLRISRDP